MWSGVDEVRHADQRGRDPNDGAIEGGDEDFAVGVEGLGEVEVVGGEGLEGLFEEVFLGARALAGGGDVGASINVY